MATFRHHAGDDFSGSSFLETPGVYHLVIKDVNDRPTKKGGQLIDNAAFRVDCEVLAGTTEGQEEKSIGITYFYPKSTSKDGGDFATKKIDRFFLAVGVIQEGDQGQDVNIELNDIIGRQFIAKLDYGQDGKHLEVSYTDTWHVDDKAASAFPKEPEALKLLPASQRLVGSRNGQQQPSQPAPQPAASESESWDL